MTSLRVICGLGPPQSKILATPMITEVESRTQGSRPRPRTQKNFEAKAKDRPSRGLGQEPRTQTQVFSKKKRSSTFFSGEKSLQKFFFRRSLLEETKKRSLQNFRKVSGVFQRNFIGSKTVLSSSRGQGNYRKLKASRPRPRPSKCVLEDVFEAKNVLEDSTSVVYFEVAKLMHQFTHSK